MSPDRTLRFTYRIDSLSMLELEDRCRDILADVFRGGIVGVAGVFLLGLTLWTSPLPPVPSFFRWVLPLAIGAGMGGCLGRILQSRDRILFILARVKKSSGSLEEDPPELEPLAPKANPDATTRVLALISCARCGNPATTFSTRPRAAFTCDLCKPPLIPDDEDTGPQSGPNGGTDKAS